MGDGWACYDCAALVANGPDGYEPAESSKWLDGRCFGWGRSHGPDVEGCGRDHGDNEDERTECETITFSSLPCDVCGTTLAGWRLGVHELEVRS